MLRDFDRAFNKSRGPQILLALALFWLRIPPMTKRALFAVAGFVALCHSVAAQQTQRREPLQLEGSTVNRPVLRLPSLTLEDQNRFFFSTAFGSMQPAMDFLPSFSPAEPMNFAYVNGPTRRNSSESAVELRAPDRVQFGGEMGFLYGKSSGKYGREDFQSYIIGTVGTDKFSITAGFFHQETTFSNSRWRR
ncbi:MAG: hypothetical protein QOE34_2870 [Verrucomicrobiota bacterium]|jgi:hypothetical protein